MAIGPGQEAHAQCSTDAQQNFTDSEQCRLGSSSYQELRGEGLRPEWTCGSCQKTNWMQRSVCRGCGGERPAHAKQPKKPRREQSRSERKPTPDSRPVQPAPPEPTTKQGDSVTGVVADEEEWATLTVPQLKAELNKLQGIAQQLKSLGLTNAAAEAQRKADVLKEFQRRRMPEGQRIDMLSASHRRAVQAKERSQQHLQELQRKMFEAQEALQQACRTEEEAAAALREAQQAVLANASTEQAAAVHTDLETTQRITEMLMHGLQSASTWTQEQAQFNMLTLVRETLTRVAAAPSTPSVLEEVNMDAAPTQVDSTVAADTAMPPFALLNFPPPASPPVDDDQGGYGAARSERTLRTEPYANRPAVPANAPLAAAQAAWEHS